MKKRSEKVIHHINVKGEMSVDQLLREMSGAAFGASRLSEAAKIYEEMLRDKRAKKFFGLAGAMVPAGLKHVVVDLIRDGYIDVLVTTGANLVHDLVEAFGGKHFKGSCAADDRTLYKKGISRIYDVYTPAEHFELLEKNFIKVLQGIDKQELSVMELLYEVGLRIEDNNSILHNAAEKQIPVFCPALADSMIGLHTWVHSQEDRFVIDACKDMKEISDICFSSSRNGAMIVGGGVPKNFIFQSMLMSPNYFNYAIQITTDRPESGGLSGATLEEAISWGKVAGDAKIITVYCDATIALPLIVAAVRSRL